MSVQQTIEIKKAKRSTFKNDFFRYGSGKIGDLEVAYVKECIPGEIDELNHSIQINMNPLKEAAFADMDVLVDSFFVPSKLCYKDFHEVIMNYEHQNKIEIKDCALVNKSGYEVPYTTLLDIMKMQFFTTTHYDSDFTALGDYLNPEVDSVNSYKSRENRQRLFNQVGIPLQYCLNPYSKKFCDHLSNYNSTRVNELFPLKTDAVPTTNAFTSYNAHFGSDDEVIEKFKSLFNYKFWNFYDINFDIENDPNVPFNVMVTFFLFPKGSDIYHYITTVNIYFYYSKNENNEYIFDGSTNMFVNAFHSDFANKIKDIKVNILPFIAYQKVYEQFYKNTLANTHDFDYQSVIYQPVNSNTEGQTALYDMPWQTLLYINTLFQTRNICYKKDFVNTSVSNPTIVNSYTFSNNINDLRKKTALQRLAEKRALTGGTFGRIWEFVASTFNYMLSDQEIDRPMYLGTSQQRVDINTIFQQSETATTPQGTRTGIAGSWQNDSITFTAPDYGYLIVMFRVRPKQAYVNGIDRNLLHVDASEFLIPDLATIGFQDIKEIELSFPNSNTPQAYSYAPRYYEYKEVRNGVSGDLALPSTAMHQQGIYGFNPIPPYNWQLGKIRLVADDYVSDQQEQQQPFNQIFAYINDDLDPFLFKYNGRLITNTTLPSNDLPQL